MSQAESGERIEINKIEEEEEKERIEINKIEEEEEKELGRGGKHASSWTLASPDE